MEKGMTWKETVLRKVIGRRNSFCKMADIEPSLAEKLKTWLEKGENFFVFLGCSGCGKTAMCSSIINDLCDHNMAIKGRQVRYIKMHDLFTKLKNNLHLQGAIEDIVKEISDGAYLLMIDGMTLRFESDWQKDIIEYLIDLRHKSQKPTIITSTYEPQEIKQELGYSSFSRIFDKDNVFFSEFTRDYRLGE